MTVLWIESTKRSGSYPIEHRRGQSCRTHSVMNLLNPLLSTIRNEAFGSVTRTIKFPGGILILAILARKGIAVLRVR